MNITVAELIVRFLESEGIEYAFGICGSHLLPLLKTLSASKKIRYISVKHECAAAFMGMFYAQVSQKPPLILATAGPGAANLVNGVAEMYKAGIPSIILTAQVPISSFNKNALQEDSGYGTSYSVNSIFENITRVSIRALNAERMYDHLKELFRKALTVPYGPAHICIPTDIFDKETVYNEFIPMNYRLCLDLRVELPKIRQIFKMIKNATNPVLLIGSRCKYPDCSKELQQLIENYNFPFILTQGSKGLISERQNLFGGIMDYFGHKSAEKILKNSDFIITFGMDFSETETIKYDPELFCSAKLIVIDCDVRHFGLAYDCDLFVAGSLKETINELIYYFKKVNFKCPIKSQKFFEEFLIINKFQWEEMDSNLTPVPPQVFYKKLSDILPENSIVCCDMGASSFASVRHLMSRKGEYYISTGGYSMAQAVAGCIGAKLAKPEKFVICVCGDGAFLMCCNETLTALQYKIGVTWMIFKDDLLNMVNINQELVYNSLNYCVELQNPDYKLFAKSVGAVFFDVHTTNDLEKSIEYSVENNKKGTSAIIVVNYNHKQHLPFKPRIVKSMQELGQTKNIKSTPPLMRALKKILRERVT